MSPEQIAELEKAMEAEKAAYKAYAQTPMSQQANPREKQDEWTRALHRLDEIGHHCLPDLIASAKREQALIAALALEGRSVEDGAWARAALERAGIDAERIERAVEALKGNP